MSIGRRPQVSAPQITLCIYAHFALEHKHCLQTGCDFDGPNQAALDEHLTEDHFQCVGCKRIFQSQTKLNHHAEACKFAIACPRCREPYPGQAQLAVHLEHCFLCEECGYCTHHEGNHKIVSDTLTVRRVYLRTPVNVVQST
jgi:hypothetical protein